MNIQDAYFDLHAKISSLQDTILNAHPTLPILLREIHKIIKDDPSCVTVLSEAEIKTIVSGLEQQTKTTITEASLKKKVSLKGVNLADL